MEFPAVTICDKNQVRRSFLSQIDVVDPDAKDYFPKRLRDIVHHVYIGDEDHPEESKIICTICYRYVLYIFFA